MKYYQNELGVFCIHKNKWWWIILGNIIIDKDKKRPHYTNGYINGDKITKLEVTNKLLELL